MKPVTIRNPIRIAGLSRKQAAELVRSLRESEPAVSIAFLPAPPGYDVFVHDLSRNPGRYASAMGRIESSLEKYVYGNGDESIVEAVGRRLIDAGNKIAVAESLTGGLLSDRLTDVPGSSSYFMLSVVTYSNDSKVGMLGVSRKTLDRWGAVSRQACGEMLAGLSQYGSFDYRIAVTGIAGPDGGSPEKPVGTVYVGFQGEGRAVLKRLRLIGGRRDIKEGACAAVMDLLWRSTAGLPFS